MYFQIVGLAYGNLTEDSTHSKLFLCFLLEVTDEIVSTHYGIAGKRRAVLLFLSEVALRDKPQTLLLHSSEEMSWMVADPVFTQR